MLFFLVLLKKIGLVQSAILVLPCFYKFRVIKRGKGANKSQNIERIRTHKDRKILDIKDIELDNNGNPNPKTSMNVRSNLSIALFHC